MAVFELRTLRDGSGRYTQTVVLDGQPFFMKLQFSTRSNAWTLDLHDQSDAPITGCVGRKLVANYFVLRSVDPRRPPGELIVASAETDDDPTLRTLGGAQVLQYMDAEELGRPLDFFGT